MYEESLKFSYVVLYFYLISLYPIQ